MGSHIHKGRLFYRSFGRAVWVALCLTVLLACAFGQEVQTVCDHSARLQTIAQVKSLSAAQAACNVPVELQGTVTTLSGWKNSFFLHDASGSISVDRSDARAVVSGDIVKLHGTTNPGSFAPVIMASEVEVLGHGSLPRAVQANYSELASGGLDSSWVEVSGVVHSVRVAESWGQQVLFLDLAEGGVTFSVRVLQVPPNPQQYQSLIGATVKVRGAAGAVFNGHRQIVGARIFTPDLSQVVVNSRAPEDPFSAPEIRIDEVFRYGSKIPVDRRVRLSGVVQYRFGNDLYVMSHGSPVLLHEPRRLDLPAGVEVDAAGFLQLGRYPATVVGAEIKLRRMAQKPNPAFIDIAHAIQRKNGFVFVPQEGQLINVQGLLVDQTRDSAGLVLTLSADAERFRVRVMGTEDTARLEQAAPGTLFQITGILSTIQDSENVPQSLVVLVNSPREVHQLSSPFSTNKIFLFVVGILVLLLAALGWYSVQIKRLVRRLSGDVESSSGPWLTYTRRYSRIVGGICATVGMAVFFIGWGLDVKVVRAPIPGKPAMYPASALCLLSCGLAIVALNTRRRSRLLSWVVVAAGALPVVLGSWSVIRHIVLRLPLPVDGVKVSIYTMLLKGWMAPVSAICLVLCGFALLLLRFRIAIALSQVMAAIVAALCLLNTLGQLYGIAEIFAFSAHVSMAIPTMVCLFLLSSSLFFARPDQGVAKNFTSSGTGGAMARWMAPAAILVPTILSWFCWYSQFKLSYFDTTVGLALFTVSNIVVFMVITWLTAGFLDRLGTDRDRIRVIASHDPLTGVFNRKGITDALEKELRRCQRPNQHLSLIVADIDFFKSINDTYGHAVGDDVLKEVSSRLRSGLREYDSLGRIGGEEFLAILPGCTLEDARNRAEQLRRKIVERPIAAAGHEIPVTISLGLTSTEHVEAVPASLFDQADKALYRAKKTGRNKVVTVVEMKEEALTSVAGA